MTNHRAAIGGRAKIIDLLHSPARTRAYGAWLMGQRGKIVGVLRNDTLALLKLDVAALDIPNGVQRWPVHWDDLLIYAWPSEPGEPERPFRLGLSGPSRDAVKHAVQPETPPVAVCGAVAHPLPVCGWS
ncbi:hypothetical protein GCM10010486_81940 [Nonomuraea roseoviolacea subsp. carminata]